MTDTTTYAPLEKRIQDELFFHRILLLDGELDDHGGTQLISQLWVLAKSDPRKGVQLWINSPGGSVPAMLAIADAMDAVPCTVSTLALGMAASAGQFLLTAGDPGHRYALPHSRVLLHQGSAGFGGSAADIELQAEDLRELIDQVMRITAARTGQPFEKVFDDAKRDRWFSAEAAKAYGFLDHVVSDFDQVGAAA
ncbi:MULTISPECIES: ClpP family protease [Barrientosiimonas]|uniref:ATP-dependent Clp protease proteolytic subunit n=1 Tax=Barrientosiimonas endolithica TaxID=1535208 RepID=A0ABM8H886_9MICO|nr:ATP-dependent Clp protease proteolytic subunit [Barrientosiimonas endolithica]BDZ57090.1 ATP-dependent Clp protease proteolytic subunit [Barrientosiimonas endolithica]